MPHMTIPKIARTKNSHDLKLKAMPPSMGEKMARQTSPKNVPIADAPVARPIAYPPLPALGQRMSVKAGGSVSRRARNIQKDGRM